ncbi:signal peptidase II [bacterium]|nr:signal peptidase II [bacterium]MBU1153447.1 signal peptidase II [bacterium]MBU1782793.1 signal peptidase II [bacterium]MBU2599699.1 signal peptidase II [bacterium]
MSFTLEVTLKDKRSLAFYSVFLVVLFLDQTSKYLIRCAFQLGEGIWLIKDVLSICHIQNQGIAFSLLTSLKDILIYLNLALAGMIVFIYQKIKKRVGQIFIDVIFGLIIGGTTGNIIDRFLFKGVIDFLDLGWKSIRWPVFNLADMAICLGMFLLCFFLYKEEKEKGNHLFSEK